MRELNGALFSFFHDFVKLMFIVLVNVQCLLLRNFHVHNGYKVISKVHTFFITSHTCIDIEIANCLVFENDVVTDYYAYVLACVNEKGLILWPSKDSGKPSQLHSLTRDLAVTHNVWNCSHLEKM